MNRNNILEFLEIYKNLDELCRQILSSDRGVSEYIDEMDFDNQRGQLVAGWERDYKQLKRMRWIRNRLVHEVDAFDENLVKQIPDFDTELDQSISFIFESEITKKALVRSPFDNFANILLEIIHSIDRLADNCHIAEFTNHAMPHICSIIKRASKWAESDGWVKRISSQEAAYLLLALLIHDIGMLSQDAKYIPVKERSKYIKGSSDIANWVRRTHVIRIDGLVKYILNEYIKKDVELEIHLNVVDGWK